MDRGGESHTPKRKTDFGCVKRRGSCRGGGTCGKAEDVNVGSTRGGKELQAVLLIEGGFEKKKKKAISIGGNRKDVASHLMVTAHGSSGGII